MFGFLLYFGYIAQDSNLENISFNENIEYCTNIMYNPNMQKDFLEKCDEKQTQKYIMIVKGKYEN